MTTPLFCLLFFAGWTLVPFILFIAGSRTVQVLRGQKKANAFPTGEPHGTDGYQRVMRAHANCLENLPVFASVVLIGAVTGFSAERFDQLAIVYVVARVAQTIAHVTSGSARAVQVRFSFFVVQVACVVWMGSMFIGQV